MPEEEKPPLDKEGTPQHIAAFKNSIYPQVDRARRDKTHCQLQRVG